MTKVYFGAVSKYVSICLHFRYGLKIVKTAEIHAVCVVCIENRFFCFVEMKKRLY